MNIPEIIQKRVVNYLMDMQNSRRHQKELDKFLAMISPSLKTTVVRYLFKNIT